MSPKLENFYYIHLTINNPPLVFSFSRIQPAGRCILVADEASVTSEAPAEVSHWPHPRPEYCVTRAVSVKRRIQEVGYVCNPTRKECIPWVILSRF